jgi:hypothetical protein
MNKKVYFSVQTALEDTPREQWPRSHAVLNAILTCPRIRGTARRLLIRRGVDLENTDDVISEVARVMFTSQLKKLDFPDKAYSLIFRVVQLVVYGFGKKSVNTYYSQEISISTLLEPGDNEEDALERITSDSAMNSPDSDTEQRIDLSNAQRRLKEKLARLGWPEEIQRERTRMGRPKKMEPIETGSISV